jgi:hypothetical protein
MARMLPRLGSVADDVVSTDFSGLLHSTNEPGPTDSVGGEEPSHVLGFFL